ncbi:Outer membrane protein H precursor [Altererythrobacter epoxidivorans]|uniref:Outer membrane protein H n=1 Tax=Altererythrobacter epoxidivorans TaxID=361183 RepID=A0A0M5KY94_9SPHN|nr:OmpH family outer membrane protein [Altererythrobacter epoxidivorans]ALE15999.1 Outer membrane protein H precursor [Altererythrobacter epoxidivorans]
MKIISKSALAAGLAMTAVIASVPAPVAAQVNGMATSNPTMAILRAAARTNAYQQINTTYAANIQQVNQLNTEITNLQISLDTNKDNQLSDAEITANPTVVQQIQAKEQQAATATQPIAMAQYYAIEQLMNDYVNARNQVLASKKVTVLIAPDAIQYAPDGFDITTDIVAAIDSRLPSVTTTVPAGWQPRRQTVEMHQAIQQILVVAAQQAAARQAQQQQQGAQAPAGR